MTQDSEFDVVVIGGGPGGASAAQYLIAEGLDVALIEERLIGGECHYWACNPTKSLLRPIEVLAPAEALEDGALGDLVEVRNLSTMAGMILHGLGISLLPGLTLFEFQHPELTAIPLAPPGISRAIQIIWRKDKPLSVAAQAMLELVRQRKPAS